MGNPILPLRKRKIDRHNFIGIVAIHLLAAAAIWRLAFFSHGAVEWLLFGVFVFLLYSISLLGVTLCYHRWLVPTHKAFSVPARWFRRTLLTAVAISAQGSVRSWVPDHTVHHMHEDQAGSDPHTPDEFLPIGENGERDDAAVASLRFWQRIRLKLKGCFWAHVGWRLWKQNSFVHKTVKRQRQRLFDPNRAGGHTTEVVEDLEWQCRWIWPLIIVPGFALPVFLGGIILGAMSGLEAGMYGALDMFLVAGFLRLVLSLNATWSVNSFGHLIGTPAKYRPCGCVWEKSHARNCALLMLVTMGEWGHGNHHYDGTCASFSERCDPGKWVLILCERFGLVTNVNWERKERRCPVHG